MRYTGAVPGNYRDPRNWDFIPNQIYDIRLSGDPARPMRYVGGDPKKKTSWAEPAASGAVRPAR